MSQALPSNAQNPDLDWSQIRETVMMLHLAVAHIEKAMHDGDDSVNTLTDSFTSMVGHAEVIRSAAEALADSQEKAAISDHCNAIHNKMQSAIIAFQFYDKLAQRLAHVSNSLSGLAGLVNNPQQLYNPYEWKGLQEMIKSKYTINEDRAMFEAVLNGASVEEALKQSQTQATQEDDIELF